LLSGANLIHDLAYMDQGKLYSIELLVLCDDLLNMLAPFRRGISCDELDEGLSVLKEVGPGGNFLEHEHTLDNYKKIWYPEIFDHGTDNHVESSTKKINKKTLDLIENYQGSLISDEKLEIIEKFEEKWKSLFP